MRQLFGTDGIRSVAGEYPLDQKTVVAIGRALGQRLAARDKHARVVIGQDTRESGAWISAALAAGLESAQVDVVSAGVMPTPGIAYLTRFNKFSAPASLSPNRTIPGGDNGIQEQPALTFTGFPMNWNTLSKPTSSPTSNSWRRAHPTMWYPHRKCCQATALNGNNTRSGSPISSKLWISAACACWSIAPTAPPSSIAPLVFQDCSIVADFLHVEPNGRNINAGCGALHPEHVAQAVAASNGKYELGITFDGDADRASSPMLPDGLSMATQSCC